MRRKWLHDWHKTQQISTLVAPGLDSIGKFGSPKDGCGYTVDLSLLYPCLRCWGQHSWAPIHSTIFVLPFLFSADLFVLSAQRHKHHSATFVPIPYWNKKMECNCMEMFCKQYRQLEKSWAVSSCTHSPSLRKLNADGIKLMSWARKSRHHPDYSRSLSRGSCQELCSHMGARAIYWVSESSAGVVGQGIGSAYLPPGDFSWSVECLVCPSKFPHFVVHQQWGEEGCTRPQLL